MEYIIFAYYVPTPSDFPLTWVKNVYVLPKYNFTATVTGNDYEEDNNIIIVDLYYSQED